MYTARRRIWRKKAGNFSPVNCEFEIRGDDRKLEYVPSKQRVVKMNFPSMKKVRQVTVVAAILLLGACTQVIVQDGSRGGTYNDCNEHVNILVMGDDSNPNALPRDHQAFERVINAIATELQTYGFTVYDETALTLRRFKQGRVGRADDELIDIARSVDEAPIDVAVIFSVFPQRDSRAYTTKVYARVEGRMIDVRAGRRLGNFSEDTAARVNAPTSCTGNCLYGFMGSLDADLAREVGRVLSVKLDRRVASNNSPRRSSRYWSNPRGLQQAYKIEFIGFHPQQITNIEDFISAFEGYIHHRVMQRSRETRKIYWYETRSGTAQMDRSLRLMLDDLKIRSRIKFERNTFFVNRI